MSFWKLLYYETVKKECYIDSFIDSVSIRNQAKMLAMIGTLEERGINLHRPYADLLRDGIHELRFKLSGRQVRALYFFIYRKYIVLTHAFVKTTNRVPDKEIKYAIACRNDFCKRLNEETIEESLQ